MNKVQIAHTQTVQDIIMAVSFAEAAGDAELILKRIQSYDGVLPFNDKADPDTIKAEFGMSKAAFKRAVGRLLKENRVKIFPDSIRIR